MLYSKIYKLSQLLKFHVYQTDGFQSRGLLSISNPVIMEKIYKLRQNFLSKFDLHETRL